jgi:hypothetical protein
MSAEMMQQTLDMIEAEAHSRPAPFEYELAYHAPVAINRVRIPIRQTELAWSGGVRDLRGTHGAKPNAGRA